MAGGTRGLTTAASGRQPVGTGQTLDAPRPAGPVVAAVVAVLVGVGVLPGAGASADTRDVDAACGDLTVLPEFVDIGGFAEATQEAIRCMAAYQITVGFGDGTFRPGEPVQRYHMALFLARVLDYAAAHDAADLPEVLDDPGFADTADLSGEAQQAIRLLYTLGITTGTTATTFSPNAPVNRRDMARFIARIQAGVLDAPDGYYLDDLSQVDAFPDVPADDGVFGGAADIYALAAAGVAGGHADGTFRPFDAVIRAHMALFVMRHLDENITHQRLPALADTDHAPPAT